MHPGDIGAALFACQIRATRRRVEGFVYIRTMAATPLRALLPRIARCVGSIAAAAWVAMMLIGAGPGSDTMSKLYPKVEPVLDFFNVDNEWGFFAPNPEVGTVVRYRLVDGNGEPHDFHLHEALVRWDPMFLRYTTLYMSIVENEDAFEPGAVRYLCHRHADMSPRTIAIVVAEQDVVTPDEFLEGRGILDDLDITVRTARRCPDGEVTK